MDHAPLPHTTGRIARRLAVIAVPMMIQSLVEYALVFTDTLFVGRYSLEGLTAVQSALSPFFTLLSFLMALAGGVTILVAQRLGAGDPARAAQYTEASFFYTSILTLGYFLFWYFAGGLVMGLVGTSGPIRDQGTAYLRILSFQFLTAGLAWTATSVFQGLGRTVPIMVTSIVRSLLNILLDWILIFGNLGFPEMGIPGAALATTISQVAGGLWLFLWFIRVRPLPITVRGLRRPRMDRYLGILRLGVPSGLEFILWSTAQTVIITLLNRSGELLAGYFGLLNTLMIMAVFIYYSFAGANTTVVGHAVGAGEPRIALRSTWLSLGVAVIVCSLTGVLFLGWTEPLLRLFSPDPRLREAVAPLMIWVVVSGYPRAANIVFGGGLRGRGETLWMLYTQIAGSALVAAVSLWMYLRDALDLTVLMLLLIADEMLRSLMNGGKLFGTDAPPPADTGERTAVPSRPRVQHE